MITGREEREAALQSIAHGASDFYQKPIDAQTLAFVVDRAFRIHELEAENRRLARQAQLSAGNPTDGLIAQSAVMESLKTQTRRFAGTDISVLINGETGTGKELIARALHDLSPRKDGPNGGHQLRGNSRKSAGERTLRL